jgi:hypothetical protein
MVSYLTVSNCPSRAECFLCRKYEFSFISFDFCKYCDVIIALIHQLYRYLMIKFGVEDPRGPR